MKRWTYNNYTLLSTVSYMYDIVQIWFVNDFIKSLTRVYNKKMFDNNTFLCSECVQAHMKSTIRLYMILAKAPCDIFWDSEGNLHQHKSESSKYLLVCSNNHWIDFYNKPKPCKILGCPWSKVFNDTPK